MYASLKWDSPTSTKRINYSVSDFGKSPNKIMGKFWGKAPNIWRE